MTTKNGANVDDIDAATKIDDGTDKSTATDWAKAKQNKVWLTQTQCQADLIN